jgi:hypothetical protein
MRNRRRQSSPIERLRLAIDCLPPATRKAMLDGVLGSERIIVGAYTDGSGGVCPMLAAHRCGGRTDFASFAKSWDRFARSRSGARAASEREVRILLTQLRASLAEADGVELDRAIAEHRTLIAERVRRAARGGSERAGQVDPTGEIRARRLRRYRPSPGRTNMISGTTHAGETRSRKRTDSAMSSGRIISEAGTCSLTKSVIGVSTNAGHSAVDLIPSALNSLFIASVQPTTPCFVAE